MFDAAGALVQTFGQGALTQGAGVAIDSKTGDVYVVDAGEEKVDVFQPEGERAPAVSGLSALDRSPSETRLEGQVNPEGSDTHYYFQYGTADCVSEPQACSDTPAAPGGDLGAGFADQPVQVTLSGLSPATAYHYRLVARNASGEAQASTQLETFQTLPSSQGLLADDRAWELVSPAEKDGSSIEPLEREGSLIQAAAGGEGISYVASAPVVGEPAGNRASEPVQVISTRTAGGWVAEDAGTPHEKGEGLELGEPSEFRFFSEDLALGLVQPPGIKQEPFEAPPLAEGATEKTLYVRDSPGAAPAASEQTLYAQAHANRGFRAPGFVPLVTPLDVTGETSPGEKSRLGGQLEFLDATPDLSHVVLESGVPLLAGSAAGLYEWSADGGLQQVSVLPDGAPAAEPALGDEGVNVRGALSQDGARVIFTAEGGEGEAQGLYMRDLSTGETLPLNTAQGVVEPTGEEAEVAFQAATPNGSKVFFTDTAPLTAESAQRPVVDENNPADLYECEITQREGKLACDLKDLTPLATGGSADVLNVIAGVGEDGSSVYFAANGVLAPGASQGDCTHEAQETAPPGAMCNLYLWHEGEITFIASLSNEDSGDWGSLHGVGTVTGSYSVNRPDLADLTARVSPNGRFLAFMSQMPLVGYETLDANHAAEGVRDEEVYLYDSSTRLLSCVSCDPNGPPTGVHDVEHAGEGEGLVVNRRGDWSGEYLAGSIPGWTPLGVNGAIHQPRYLSDQGRLFFNSPDQLAPQANNAKMDAYEYEPDGVGSCAQQDGCVSLISSGGAAQESAFVEASENGDEAFFVTAQQLVAADHDGNYDLYDARVCSESSPCLSSQASSANGCESSRTCEPDSTPAPVFGTPASAMITTVEPQPLGSTTPAPKPAVKPKPPTRAQLLAKTLEACHKQKSKRKRLVCEKQAYKRYGPKADAKKTAKRTAKRRRK